MATAEKKELSIHQLAEHLVSFAMDRDDTKELLAQMPETEHINLNAVEYELQILKIVSVGWGISYCMQDPVNKENLSSLFWNAVNQVAKNVSEVASSTTETTVDYFQIIKERMEMYVQSLYSCTAEDSPVTAIGPAFAEACGLKDEVFTIRAGARMFQMTVNSTKEYLEYVIIT